MGLRRGWSAVTWMVRTARSWWTARSYSPMASHWTWSTGWCTGLTPTWTTSKWSIMRARTDTPSSRACWWGLKDGWMGVHTQEIPATPKHTQRCTQECRLLIVLPSFKQTAIAPIDFSVLPSITQNICFPNLYHTFNLIIFRGSTVFQLSPVYLGKESPPLLGISPFYCLDWYYLKSVWFSWLVPL